MKCLDLSPKMVARCQQRGLHAEVCDFTAGLPGIATESVDAVYCMNSLLHVPKRLLPALVAEVARVLKPNGVLYVGVYGGDDFEGRWQADPSGCSRFFSYHTDDSLRAALSHSGRLEVLHLERIDTGGGSTSRNFQSALLRRTTLPATDTVAEDGDAPSTSGSARRSSPSLNCHLDQEKVARWHAKSDALLKEMDAMIEARAAARAAAES